MWHLGGATILSAAALAAGGATAIIVTTSGPWRAGGEQEPAASASLLDSSELSVRVLSGGAPLKNAVSVEPGLHDGPGSAALFGGPLDLALQADGSLVVVERINRVVRSVLDNGDTLTIAGSGDTGSTDGTALNATFRSPVALAIAEDGTVFVVDAEASVVRGLSPDGEVSTIAGVDFAECTAEPKKEEERDEAGGDELRPEDCPAEGEPWYRDGAGHQALFNELSGIAVVEGHVLLVSDWDNSCIRSIDEAGIVSTFAGVCTQRGHRDGAVKEALFNGPGDIAIGSDGRVYVVDHGDSVRMIDGTGTVTTVYEAPAANDGFGGGARPGITGIAVDENGFVYVTETQTQLIRQIAPDGASAVIAGIGGQGFRMGPADDAQFSYPTGIAVAPDGRIYFADHNLGRIFVLEASGAGNTGG